MSLLRFIHPTVETAAREAGNIAPIYSVPFPGTGQQGRFAPAMAKIVSRLPMLPGANVKD